MVVVVSSLACSFGDPAFGLYVLVSLMMKWKEVGPAKHLMFSVGCSPAAHQNGEFRSGDGDAPAIADH